MPSRRTAFSFDICTANLPSVSTLSMKRPVEGSCTSWDRELTFEKSYLARLNYVHHNPVHHKLVPVTGEYAWCSARWFETKRDRLSCAVSILLRPTN